MSFLRFTAWLNVLKTRDLFRIFITNSWKFKLALDSCRIHIFFLFKCMKANSLVFHRGGFLILFVGSPVWNAEKWSLSSQNEENCCFCWKLKLFLKCFRLAIWPVFTGNVCNFEKKLELFELKAENLEEGVGGLGKRRDDLWLYPNIE